MDKSGETILRLRCEIDQLRAKIEEQKATATRCACEVPQVPACSESCTCRTPLLSGGCNRCASYGSKEQQIGSAKAIAARDKED